jgi:hypothetical protein
VNYAELVQAITDFSSENNDTLFQDNIPTFVQNAEKRIYQAIKIPAFFYNTTISFVQDDPTVSLPSDYLTARELAVIVNGAYYYLLPKDVSFIREAYPDPTSTGVPRYFAHIADTTLTVAPTPAAAYIGSLGYFYYPESIVTAGTTWLGNNFDNLLLYGAMVEAAAFMKSDPDIVKQYSEQYAVNLKLLQEYAKGQHRSDTYRR